MYIPSRIKILLGISYLKTKQNKKIDREIFTLCFPLIKLCLHFPFNCKTSHKVSPHSLYYPLLLHFLPHHSIKMFFSFFFFPRPPMTSISLNSRIIFHLCLISNSAFQNIRHNSLCLGMIYLLNFCALLPLL